MNIIVLVCDALRANNLGCYGYDKNTSPQIDRIAERGIRFSNAFSTANSTDASFTTIFTGKYPTSHGIRHHGSKVTDAEKSYTTKLSFLPEILQEHGYVTIGLDWLGKWHRWGYDFYAGIPNYSNNRRKINPQANSQDENCTDKKQKPGLYFSGIQKYLSKLNIISSRCNWYYSLPDNTRKYIRRFFQFQDKVLHNSLSGRKSRPIVTDAAALTDMAIKYIQKYANKKDFFLFVHYWDTHTPYTAPKSIIKDFLQKYQYSDRKVSPVLKDLAGTKSGRIIKKSTRGKLPDTIGEIAAHYDASIKYADSNIGRLYDFLEEIKILDDTLVLITADHGESMSEHDIFFNHHGLYDPQIKIPFVISNPKIASGIVFDEFVQHFDIVPTILDVVGINNSGINFDGKSLLNLIHGQPWNRKYVFAEETLLQQKRIIRDKYYKYIKALNQDMCLYCQKYHSREDEFYSLRDDPHEENNIIGQDPKHKEYKEELDKYINALSMPEEGQKVTFDDEVEINKRLEALGYL